MTIPPHILIDPAFATCLAVAAADTALLAEYDRLRKSNLRRAGSPLELAIDVASGRLAAEAGDFAEFVREFVFDRIDPAALQHMRDCAGFPA